MAAESGIDDAARPNLSDVQTNPTGEQALEDLERSKETSEATAQAKHELMALLQHLMAGTERHMQLEEELRKLEGHALVSVKPHCNARPHEHNA